jgi:hypothetical protein
MKCKCKLGNLLTISSVIVTDLDAVAKKPSRPNFMAQVEAVPGGCGAARVMAIAATPAPTTDATMPLRNLQHMTVPKL